MVMGLCLLVYSLGQKALRQALARAKQTISNQLSNGYLHSTSSIYQNISVYQDAL